MCNILLLSWHVSNMICIHSSLGICWMEVLKWMYRPEGLLWSIATAITITDAEVHDAWNTLGAGILILHKRRLSIICLGIVNKEFVPVFYDENVSITFQWQDCTASAELIFWNNVMIRMKQEESVWPSHTFVAVHLENVEHPERNQGHLRSVHLHSVIAWWNILCLSSLSCHHVRIIRTYENDISKT